MSDERWLVHGNVKDVTYECQSLVENHGIIFSDMSEEQLFEHFGQTGQGKHYMIITYAPRKVVFFFDNQS